MAGMGKPPAAASDDRRDKAQRHWHQPPVSDPDCCERRRASGTVTPLMLSQACAGLYGLYARNRGITMFKPIAITVVITIFTALLAACTSEEQQARFFVSVTANKFDLNDQQKTKLLDVAMVALNFRTEMTQDSNELKQELLTMLSAETLDTARINRVLEEKEEIFRKYSRLLVADFAELHRTLTAEQKQKLIETLKQRGARSALRTSTEAACQTGV
jgi:uncharacterized membrane protein